MNMTNQVRWPTEPAADALPPRRDCSRHELRAGVHVPRRGQRRPGRSQHIPPGRGGPESQR